MSKYLRFVLIAGTAKTQTYHVISAHQGNVLGEIDWYIPWRQYVFEAAPDTIWNKDCLREVAAYLDGLMEGRKQRPNP